MRAYGAEPRALQRIIAAVTLRYRRHLDAAKWMAVVFTVGDLVGAFSLALVGVVGARYGQDWGIGLGEIVACLFLANLLQSPVNELGDVLDQTQVALAGWGKVLDVLDLPVEVVEAEPGERLPAGALDVVVDGRWLRLPRRAPGARGRVGHVGGGFPRCGRRRDGVGEDHLRETAVPARGPCGRSDPHQWRGPAQGRRAEPT